MATEFASHLLFNSEIVWRVPMASTEIDTKLSGVLASLSETLADFRAESEEIESRFFELVEGISEVDALPDISETPGETLSPETIALESIAVEHLENLDRSMTEQREEFAGKQDQLSEDVGQLRELVDRQAQLFAAWIRSTTNVNKTNPSRKGKRKNSSEDEVLNDVFVQFEELRGAAATTSRMSTT